ncbi:short-chain dehydrogenase [Rhodococcus erythropolis]|uniref:SDR family NAD(P)-dependent oxidoreductase n=1 Tax=Rhodococcus erythropolis TaxID=1833 RepID=UPI00061B899E|nr:SDR family NAD(P)-dependent oxidoreductase [Rhodococcus erythropolis]AKD99988.1 short-chain dehydrogenase [Rhodococcus erythropolis]
MPINTSRFAGKTAVVTGAASGIGAAIALRLIGEGAQVAGIDIDAEGLKEIASQHGASFLAVPADVTKESDVAEAIAAAAAEFGGIDLAFNVAGASRVGQIVDLDEADWDFTIDLVQKGVFLCTKHEARHIREHGRGGAIVNVSSLNAHVPSPYGSAYATGKAGVEMFSKNAAIELAASGIRVNAVLPGLVDTPLVAPVMNYEPARDMFLSRIPMSRAATPDEISGPCLYLASDDASYITGTSLVVDGGWEVSNYPDLTTLGN